MNFEQALSLLKEGKKVRLPEWTGYWFEQRLNIDGPLEIFAFTRTGDIVVAQVDKFSNRDDWQECSGALGFDFAIIAMRAGKRVRRFNWPKFAFIWIDLEYGEGYIWTNVTFDPDREEWFPAPKHVLATDWVLAD